MPEPNLLPYGDTARILLTRRSYGIPVVPEAQFWAALRFPVESVSGDA